LLRNVLQGFPVPSAPHGCKLDDPLHVSVR
jgi:hypothetical protein